MLAWNIPGAVCHDAEEEDASSRVQNARDLGEERSFADGANQSKACPQEVELGLLVPEGQEFGERGVQRM